MSATRAQLACLAALAVAVAACGGAQGPRVTSPFTEADAVIFDDAFDRLATPADLPEGFRERWQHRLAERAARSDVVAVVTVPSLRTDTNPDRSSRLRIVARVERQLFGDSVEELVLPVRADEAGWETVTGREERLLEGTFVAYVKWVHPPEPTDESLDVRRERGDEADDDEPPVEARWHLSPASEQVVSETERALAARAEDD